VKRKAELLLFRLDYLELFHRILKDSEVRNDGVREARTFIRYYIRRLSARLESSPVLFVELLFTKTTDTAFFMDHGFARESVQTKKLDEVNAALHTSTLLREEEESEEDDFSGGLDDERFKAKPGALEESGKKTRKKRVKAPKRRRIGTESSSDEGSEPQKQRGSKNQQEKMSLIKSSMYICSSDDETDEERDRAFFAREAALREEYVRKMMNELDEE
jgi:hypothetical protein